MYTILGCLGIFGLHCRLYIYIVYIYIYIYMIGYSYRDYGRPYYFSQIVILHVRSYTVYKYILYCVQIYHSLKLAALLSNGCPFMWYIILHIVNVNFFADIYVEQPRLQLQCGCNSPKGTRLMAPQT